MSQDIEVLYWWTFTVLCATICIFDCVDLMQITLYINTEIKLTHITFQVFFVHCAALIAFHVGLRDYFHYRRNA